MVSVYQLAHDPNTPPKVLIALSKDNDVYVRRGVAKNPNTPPETLIALSKDEYYGVREAAMNNPNCPIELKVEYILSA